MGNHTILLLQPANNQSTRSYYDFNSESEAMDHIAGLYETRLAKENPNAGQVQYRAEDLFRFIDTYKEFVALVFDASKAMYQPRDIVWIKESLIAHFSGQSAVPPPPLSPPSQSTPHHTQNAYSNNQYNSRRGGGGGGHSSSSYQRRR